MEVRETGPTDDEFSKLLDERAPNRLNDPTPEALEDFPPPDDEPVLGDEPELAVAPPAVPEKYAGKTAEELVAMHQNLETRLGQQGQELGELRAMRSELDQLKGAMSERASTPAAPITQETVDWVEESVIGNPRGTMEWVEQNQPALKERALATWAAIDPFAASTYKTEQMLAEQRAQFDQELAAVKAPVAAQTNDRQLEAAYLTVSNTLPGFSDVAEDLPGILEANPELKVALVGGDQASKTRILENIGKMAFANRALAQSATPSVPEPATPGIDPRVAASVASGSSIGEHGGEATPTDKLKASMLASEPTSLHEELARSRQAAR